MVNSGDVVALAEFFIRKYAKANGMPERPLSAEATAALAIPVVAGSVWWGLRRLHRRLFGAHH